MLKCSNGCTPMVGMNCIGCVPDGWCNLDRTTISCVTKTYVDHAIGRAIKFLVTWAEGIWEWVLRHNFLKILWRDGMGSKWWQYRWWWSNDMFRRWFGGVWRVGIGGRPRSIHLSFFFIPFPIFYDSFYLIILIDLGEKIYSYQIFLFKN